MLQDFEIIKKLGEGAYSSVYKVRRKADNIYYALKKVQIHNLSEAEKLNALNEVRIIASIRHPSIINFKQCFIDDDLNCLCIIMQYADNGDLLQLINDNVKTGTYLKQDDIWNYFIQIVQGLDALHANNIYHRDLKSANVFLCKDGSAKLGDFNVSQVAQKGLLYTQTGTPYYASPEVWKDQPYDKKADIWSLGCVLYEMCTLKPPFRSDDMQGLFKKVIKGQYSKIPSLYSNDLVTIIRYLLQVTPHLRPDCLQILSIPNVVRHMTEKHMVEPDDNEKTILMSTIRIPRSMSKQDHITSDSIDLPQNNYVPIKLKIVNKFQLNNNDQDDKYSEQRFQNSNSIYTEEFENQNGNNSTNDIHQNNQNNPQLPPGNSEKSSETRNENPSPAAEQKLIQIKNISNSIDVKPKQGSYKQIEDNDKETQDSQEQKIKAYKIQTYKDYKLKKLKESIDFDYNKKNNENPEIKKILSPLNEKKQYQLDILDATIAKERIPVDISIDNMQSKNQKYNYTPLILNENKNIDNQNLGQQAERVNQFKTNSEQETKSPNHQESMIRQNIPSNNNNNYNTTENNANSSQENFPDNPQFNSNNNHDDSSNYILTVDKPQIINQNGNFKSLDPIIITKSFKYISPSNNMKGQNSSYASPDSNSNTNHIDQDNDYDIFVRKIQYTREKENLLIIEEKSKKRSPSNQSGNQYNYNSISQIGSNINYSSPQNRKDQAQINSQKVPDLGLYPTSNYNNVISNINSHLIINSNQYLYNQNQSQNNSISYNNAMEANNLNQYVNNMNPSNGNNNNNNPPGTYIRKNSKIFGSINNKQPSRSINDISHLMPENDMPTIETSAKYKPIIGRDSKDILLSRNKAHSINDSYSPLQRNYNNGIVYKNNFKENQVFDLDKFIKKRQYYSKINDNSNNNNSSTNVINNINNILTSNYNYESNSGNNNSNNLNGLNSGSSNSPFLPQIEAVPGYSKSPQIIRSPYNVYNNNSIGLSQPSSYANQYIRNYQASTSSNNQSLTPTGTQINQGPNTSVVVSGNRNSDDVKHNFDKNTISYGIKEPIIQETNLNRNQSNFNNSESYNNSNNNKSETPIKMVSPSAKNNLEQSGSPDSQSASASVGISKSPYTLQYSNKNQSQQENNDNEQQQIQS